MLDAQHQLGGASVDSFQNREPPLYVEGSEERVLRPVFCSVACCKSSENEYVILRGVVVVRRNIGVQQIENVQVNNLHVARTD